jgi:phage terminase small subunit
VLAEWDLEAPARAILEQAAKTLDRLTEARSVLDVEGLTFPDARGNPRVRPEVTIERDARLALARLLRELGLDAEVEARPPMLRGRYAGRR